MKIIIVIIIRKKKSGKKRKKERSLSLSLSVAICNPESLRKGPHFMIKVSRSKHLNISPLSEVTTTKLLGRIHLQYTCRT
jgi:hypothetical protein